LVELERAELARDLAVEPGGRLLPRRAQTERQALIGLARGRGGPCKLRALGFARVERRQFHFEPLDELGQSIDRDLVLAGESAQRKEPLLGTFQRLGLE